MKRVLVVEDEKDMAEMIAVDLISKGYAVNLAFDGEEGLDKAIKEQPDLLILDINLPKLNGYRVCERLKSAEMHDQIKRIPVIMLTGRDADIEKEAGYALGADVYLLKPSLRAFKRATQ